jgi:hypothetical protein
MSQKKNKWANFQESKSKTNQFQDLQSLPEAME